MAALMAAPLPRRRVLHGLRAATVVAVATLGWMCATAPVHAQRGGPALGPAKCIDCHDHEKHALWWKKNDGSIKGGKVINHTNSLNRLSADRTATEKYAKALGMTEDDAYAPGSACMKCHATVYKGQPRAGISCESCHGGGANYLDIHKEKDSYQKAVAAGMLDVLGKPERWAPDCMKCHVMDDQRLLDAKHPSGDDFDLAQKFQAVAKHWEGLYGKNTGYSPAAVSAAGAGARKAAIAKRATTTGVVTARVEPPPTAPAPTVTAPPAAPPAAPAPPPTTSAPPAPAAPPTTSTSKPAPVPTGPPPPRPAGTRAPSPGRPPIVAPAPPMTPPTVIAPPIPVPGDVKPESPTPSAPAPALPPTPAGLVALLQGRLVTLLGSLLDSGARTPTRVTPPDQATAYTGADAELLRLQEEAIALALEALSLAPTTPAGQDASRPR